MILSIILIMTSRRSAISSCFSNSSNQCRRSVYQHVMHQSISCAIWLQALKSMVERCWHKDPEKRPTFQEVVKILDEQMKKVIRTGTDSRSAAAGGGSGGCCSIQWPHTTGSKAPRLKSTVVWKRLTAWPEPTRSATVACVISSGIAARGKVQVVCKHGRFSAMRTWLPLNHLICKFLGPDVLVLVQCLS